MIGVHGSEPPAVAAAYDFSGLRTIVDVGGATGSLLTTILGSYPGISGILFDLPHVVREAPTLIQTRGLAERVTIEEGNFFESVPRPGADSRDGAGGQERTEQEYGTLLSKGGLRLTRVVPMR
jgi:O-methyltransferase domain